MKIITDGSMVIETSHQNIIDELAEEGLRIAEADESGWTYTYINDESERVSLWVTDL